jgi:hypothetical protein
LASTSARSALEASTVTCARSEREGRLVLGSIRWCCSSPPASQRRRFTPLVADGAVGDAQRAQDLTGVEGVFHVEQPAFAVLSSSAQDHVSTGVDHAGLRQEASGAIGGPALHEAAEIEDQAGWAERAAASGVELEVGEGGVFARGRRALRSIERARREGAHVARVEEVAPHRGIEAPSRRREVLPGPRQGLEEQRRHDQRPAGPVQARELAGLGEAAEGPLGVGEERDDRAQGPRVGAFTIARGDEPDLGAHGREDRALHELLVRTRIGARRGA